VVAGSTVTLEFGADGQATGTAGCNAYGGRYQVQGGSISFQEIVSTLMACADEQVMGQEQQYLQALGTTGKFEISGDRLTIAFDSGQGALKYARANAVTIPTPAPTPTTGGTAGNAASPGAPTAPAASSGETQSASAYLDDRSTPTGLILSYFNAINRKEFLRAYSYWTNPVGWLGSFEKFQQDHQNTVSVDATLGQVVGASGEGQLYYSVPVLLKTRTSDGKTQAYTGCYLMHLFQPGEQGVPPFIPLTLEKFRTQPVESNAPDEDLAANACATPDPPPGNPIIPAPVTNRGDISKNNYLDDRSGPVEVLSSLFNAVNRKEYARAYSYWENAGTSPHLPPFAQFQQGYGETGTVQLATGPVISDAGAGQCYYSVPVVLTARTTAGVLQTFAGCYKLHLANPQIQAEPPFMPLAVQSAVVKQVANNADASALLSQACGQ